MDHQNQIKTDEQLSDEAREKFEESILDINLEKEQLDFKLDALLRKAGWSHSSSHPGCIWLWSKNIRGENYHVPRDYALKMEANSDLGSVGGYPRLSQNRSLDELGLVTKSISAAFRREIRERHMKFQDRYSDRPHREESVDYSACEILDLIISAHIAAYEAKRKEGTK